MAPRDPRLEALMNHRVIHRYNPELGPGKVRIVEDRTLVVEFPRTGTVLRLAMDSETYLFQVTENNKLQNIIFNDTEKLSVCNVDEKGIDEMSSHKNSILTFKPNVFVKTLTEAMLHSKHPLVILSNDSKFQGVITKKNLLNAVLKRFDQ